MNNTQIEQGGNEGRLILHATLFHLIGLVELLSTRSPSGHLESGNLKDLKKK
jgi:hypothetical protein